ncbi:ABC transporter family substrate-binding protein [Cutibacterium sp.]|uniref:ABC transporter family substrate-binding protein n=1 Tax=Cutibacterium sp. TaxID=1912221 RepID=UPI0026DA89C6|nr:ABC transporter family substrate-binding protein [Cutibacterium sp.]MDO4413379.1 ABC transporter family substrate-binding protein [Cutibacterium sp.]
MRKTLTTAVVALAVGSLALTGCGQKNQSGGNQNNGDKIASKSAPLADLNTKSRDQIKDGGTLRFAIGTMPTGWNPMEVDNNTVDLASTIWPFIGVNNIDIAEDGTAKPNPNYISSTDVDTKDGKQVVTLHLNPKAKWNSGRTIDYTDYQAMWKACNGTNDKFLPATTDGFNQVTSVEKGEKDTDVVITFKNTYPDWTSTFSIVIPKEGSSDPKVFNDGWKKPNPDWFAGPFIPTKVDDATKTLTIKRNDKWWGDKAKLDTVTFKEMEEDAKTKAFANKEIDIADGIVTKDAYQTAKKRTDVDMREAGSLQWRHFTFNGKSANLSDKNVRQAIVKGINRPAIAKSDLAGLPVDADSVMLGNHFFMPGQPGYKDNSEDYKYDVAAAEKQLEDAGWKKQGDYRVKDGKTLEVNYSQLTGVPTSENEGALFKQDMAKIGVKVNLVNTPSADMNKVLSNHSFDVISFTWQGTAYPMANVRQIYGAAAEGSKQPSQSNFSQVIDPEVEKLIPQIDTEMDVNKRRELTNQADKLIWDDVMTLPLYRRIGFTATPKNLANFGSTTFQTIRAEDVGYTK